MTERADLPPPGPRPLPVNDLPGAAAVTVDLPVPASAVAVGAHPDDVEFGCGATLAKWAASGCAVHHVILTDGSKGSWETGGDRASLVAVRQREQREAARILGATDEVHFLGWPDGELRNTVREQWELCRLLRVLAPEVVLGHDPWRRYRLHPDHRHAGFLLTDAVVAARDPLFFPEQELAPHRPRALLLWEADLPNHVEDAGRFAERKVEALLAHRSQYRSTMGVTAGDDDGGLAAFRQRVLATMSEHGGLAGRPAGEAFHLITEL